jgi:hypothetical protein
MALLASYGTVVVNRQPLLGYRDRRIKVMSQENKSRNHRFLKEYLDEGNLGVKEEFYAGVGPVSSSGQTARQALPEQRKKRPLSVRLIGYVLFLVAVLAACIALGGGIAVAMNYLEGLSGTGLF